MAKKSRKPEQTMNDVLMQDIALEMGIPVATVKDVINNGLSRFTAHVMSNNEFNGVRWPYFGTFRAKHKSVQILSYMKGLNPVQKQFFIEQLRRQRKENYEKAKKKNETLRDQQ
jgi:hypothetical protein